MKFRNGFGIGILSSLELKNKGCGEAGRGATRELQLPDRVSGMGQKFWT